MLKIDGCEVHAFIPEFHGQEIAGYYAVCVDTEDQSVKVAYVADREASRSLHQIGWYIEIDSGPLGLERAVGEAVKRMYVKAGMQHMPWDDIAAEVLAKKGERAR